MNVIYDLLEQRAKLSPNDLAVASSKQEMSFLELQSAVERVSNALTLAGVSKGKLVAVLLPDFENWIVSLAIAKIGAVGCCLPLEFEPGSEKAAFWDFIVTPPAKASATPNSIAIQRDWISKEVLDTFSPPEPMTDDDFVRAIWTSGTTGKPKVAVFKHSSLAIQIAGLQESWAGGTREFNFMPLAAVGGFLTAAASLVSGTTYLARDVSGKDLIDFLVSRKVQVLVGSAEQLSVFMNRNPEHLHLLAGIETIRLAGSSPTPGFLERLADVFDADIVSVYGATETGAIFSKQVDPDTGMDDLGTLLTGRQARVVNEMGAEVPDGAEGSLVTKSRSMFAGYLIGKDPITIQQSPEWFLTGDQAIAEGGRFKFLGRESNVVNVGGMKFDVTELEQFVRQLEGVVDALAFNAEDHLGKEILVMAIVAEDAVVRNAISKIESAFPNLVPGLFWNTDQIERGALDKPARWKTRQKYYQEQLGRELH
jgi:long-chain acyl-CoA synthetase